MKTNPYETQEYEPLATEQYARAKKVAFTAAARGLARGAILRKLKEIGIEGLAAEDLTHEALVRRQRKQQWLGVLTMLFGLILIAVGGGMMVFGARRLSIAVGMFGMFFLLLGGANTSQRRPLYRDPTQRNP